ncbi:MAG: hypothetical protein IJ302_05855 [Clostridia bacterium]|nr:hypothetical protein [Clostridia bacterium]
MHNRAAHDERGMITVEAVISFTAFILVTLGITFLINVFMLHNKIQFAINQAAHEIASYSYLYDAFGLQRAGSVIAEDGAQYTGAIDKTTGQVVDTVNKMQELAEKLNDTGGSLGDTAESIVHDPSQINQLISQLESVKNSAGSTYESGKASVNAVKDLLSDPAGLIAGVIYLAADYATDAVKRFVAEGAATALTEKYLAAGDTDVNAYLENYGIEGGYEGLDFSGSSMFCDEGDRLIDIVVEYDLDLSFLTYVLPETTYHVVQRVSVGAWAGGDGHYVTVGKD